MNKNAIKKFAIAARTRLIATVSDKAGTLGITKEGISDPASKGNGFEIYKTSAGTEIMLQGSQIEQRRRLVAQVKARGFDVVMEEVAYTWFNRICAIRFMEVNDYLPLRLRVLSSLKEGKNEPDILTEAPNVELDFSDKEREWIINAKAENRLDELFSMLFIKQCNKLSEVLPELFEATEDYTEMLLNLSYTNKDDVIRMLVDGVDEKDFNITATDENGNTTGQVEIIGWLYQYYNTELNEIVYNGSMSKGRITKELLPAATTIYTPDWVIRYMVENSLGRLWIEHLKSVNPDLDEKDVADKLGWKYYLQDIKQEHEVEEQLTGIRKNYVDMRPEDILCIDPCMGSGHIIVAMFDILMDIYKSVGFGEREAAFEIVDNNLRGLDIDKRAYQLSYFAIMMKGRQYNRRFFGGKEEGERPKPRVYSFIESNDVNKNHLKYFGVGLNDAEKSSALTQIYDLLDTFEDAREYGSILNVKKYNWELLHRFVDATKKEGQMTLDAIGLSQTQETIHRLINLGETLTAKYDVVVTNPPYFNSSRFSNNLQNYANEHYGESKADLSMIMYDHTLSTLLSVNAYTAFVTTTSWMYLKSFEKLRRNVVENYSLDSLVDFGTELFDGKVGHNPIVAWVTRKTSTKKKFQTISLVKYCFSRRNEKIVEFFNTHNYRWALQDRFLEITGCPIAYMGSQSVIDVFKERTIGNLGCTSKGIITGDNARFLRLWYEVDIQNIEFAAQSYNDSMISNKKWYPCNKGGDYRKWYGNNDFVINWMHNGNEIMQRDTKKVRNCQDYKDEYKFRPSITWTSICSGKPSFRYSNNSLSESAGMTLFIGEKWINYSLAFLNSKVAEYLMFLLNPTLNFTAGMISSLPLKEVDNTSLDVINQCVDELIKLEKSDWDCNETSQGFSRHPLAAINCTGGDYISDLFEQWRDECDSRYRSILFLITRTEYRKCRRKLELKQSLRNIWQPIQTFGRIKIELRNSRIWP